MKQVTMNEHKMQARIDSLTERGYCIEAANIQLWFDDLPGLTLHKFAELPTAMVDSLWSRLYNVIDYGHMSMLDVRQELVRELVAFEADNLR
jgi:hypothetical protein